MTVKRIVEAVTAAQQGSQSRDEVLRSIAPDDIEAVMHGGLGADNGGEILTTGVGCSPGAAVGQVYFSCDDVLDAADRGEQTILAAVETSPADEIAMRVAEGILTARGGMASHAAVVARGWGLPAVCGAEALEFDNQTMIVDGQAVHAGTTITIDGGTGAVMLGGGAVDRAEVPQEFHTLLGWADEVRGDRLTVLANADTGADATRARDLGAQGVGLCRTEHMFLGERLPVVQAVLGSGSAGAAHDEALSELVAVQRSDFVELFEAMDGLPVTVRLLDAPLHEFTPDAYEHNPMLGLRGVRLGLLRTGIFAAQVQAIGAAMRDRLADGGDPRVKIMVPLVSTVTETVRSVALVREAIIEHGSADAPVAVGTMIETPRAALVSSEIAAHVDFFSFGTNDLTQLTFGFSRDDVEGTVIRPYIDAGLLDVSPFESIDVAGVGRLVSSAVEAGRSVKPDLECGVCGEHGGDPDSVAFFASVGLNSVSASPYRVPGARLAAARALL